MYHPSKPNRGIDDHMIEASPPKLYGGGQAKSTVFFRKHTTFAPTNHQPQTPDDNNLVTRIDRESSVQ